MVPVVSDARIGRLFPAGGPVPPELVIGRAGDVDEIARRLQEAIHTMLTGDRRIGKTTVCDAACERVRSDGMVVVTVEVPERPDGTALLQLVVDRTSRISLAATGRRVLRATRPLIEKVLRDEGIPLDLSQLDAEPGALPTRTILSLPSKLAEETGHRVVFFLDEIQRAVDYADGDQLLGDLVDLYSGATDVVVLVDGSEERALEGMLGAPVQFGKLCDRLALEPRIPTYTWRESLPERFGQAGLELQPEALEALITFGAGRPYATMTGARYAAFNARKLGSETVGTFEVEEGVAEARRHLDEDA
jgi:hypothetical protein